MALAPRRRPLARLVLAALAAVAALAAAPAADEPRPLVKGDDPAQFELVAIGPETISIKDGEVRVTGKPNGYFATKEGFKDYVLTFEWMYERPEGLESDATFQGNSGLLVHISGPHKVWPQCVEVQLAHSQAGKIFGIQGTKFSGEMDVEAQKRAIKPVGQWNVEEVTCKGDAIACKINGVEVARGTGATPVGGPIGWQSEGAPIRFRNITIRTLD